MSEWKLHGYTKGNTFAHYKCGLVAGERVRLKKDLVVNYLDGVPIGTVHPRGEEWVVLAGMKSDPVLWFRRPDGERCTWDDDSAEVEEWFEKI